MDNIAFVVVSCYKYSDLWPVMMSSIKKYWPSIYKQTYLLTDSAGDLHGDYNFIVLDKDVSWSDNLIYLCENLDSEYDHVFLMMEDTPLIGKVDDIKINGYFKNFMEIKGTFLTLLNEPYPSDLQKNGLQKISIDSPYRPTATFSLWNLPKLRNLLISGESAWEFEKAGARRSEGDDGYFSFTNHQIKWMHLVVKGKLFPNVRENLIQHGLRYEGPRDNLPRYDHLRMLIYSKLRSLVFKATPLKLRKHWVKI